MFRYSFHKVNNPSDNAMNNSGIGLTLSYSF